jgi:hypothetical protein
MLYTIALSLTLVLPLSPLISYVAESEVHNLLVIAILGVLILGAQAKPKALY